MKSIRSEGQASTFNKVPEVTARFWLIKVLSTTVGETGANYLAINVGLGTAVSGASTAALLGIVLMLQLRRPCYVGGVPNSE